MVVGLSPCIVRWVNFDVMKSDSRWFFFSNITTLNPHSNLISNLNGKKIGIGAEKFQLVKEVRPPPPHFTTPWWTVVYLPHTHNLSKRMSIIFWVVLFGFPNQTTKNQKPLCMKIQVVPSSLCGNWLRLYEVLHFELEADILSFHPKRTVTSEQVEDPQGKSP